MKTSVMRTAILFVLFCLLPVSGFTQNELTEDDKKELQERVKIKVDEFQQYLSDIVNTKLTQEQRKASISSALALFIGKGESYHVTNSYGERENRLPVRMQISSLNTNSTRWLPMKKYLNNQYINVHRYGRVEIQSADVVRVDNINKVGDGKYQAVAYFCQKYVAYRDGRRVYGPDITGKKVIVYISAIDTPAGTVWDAKLGDVYVTATKAGN